MMRYNSEVNGVSVGSVDVNNAIACVDARDGYVYDSTPRALAEPVSPLSDPDSGTGTAVLERPQTAEQSQKSDDGDADRFAHYVSKDRIMQSRMTGRPVVALCGKIWVPKHDPSKYPVCPDCKRIYEEMTNH